MVIKTYENIIEPKAEKTKKEIRIEMIDKMVTDPTCNCFELIDDTGMFKSTATMASAFREAAKCYENRVCMNNKINYVDNRNFLVTVAIRNKKLFVITSDDPQKSIDDAILQETMRLDRLINRGVKK